MATCKYCGEPITWMRAGKKRGGWRATDPGGRNHTKTCRSWLALAAERRQEIAERQRRQWVKKKANTGPNEIVGRRIVGPGYQDRAQCTGCRAEPWEACSCYPIAPIQPKLPKVAEKYTEEADERLQHLLDFEPS